MFLFGKGKARADGSAKQAGGNDIFASAAADALAAAVDSSTPATASSTGRCLQGADITIQLDELRPNEVVAELKVRATCFPFRQTTAPCTNSKASSDFILAPDASMPL
jgi:hypothetical protein